MHRASLCCTPPASPRRTAEIGGRCPAGVCTPWACTGGRFVRGGACAPRPQPDGSFCQGHPRRVGRTRHAGPGAVADAARDRGADRAQLRQRPPRPGPRLSRRRRRAAARCSRGFVASSFGRVCGLRHSNSSCSMSRRADVPASPAGTEGAGLMGRKRTTGHVRRRDGRWIGTLPAFAGNKAISRSFPTEHGCRAWVADSWTASNAGLPVLDPHAYRGGAPSTAQPTTGIHRTPRPTPSWNPSTARCDRQVRRQGQRSLRAGRVRYQASGRVVSHI